MKSRYSGLRFLGTLSLIIAWVLLILGILAAIGSWLGIRNIGTNLQLDPGFWPLAGALPGLLGAILSFIWFYAIGKILHLLVDLDERTLGIESTAREAAQLPVAASSTGAEISGELNRQAKLIAANVEATQGLQMQMEAMEGRLMTLPALSQPAAVERMVVVEPVAAAAERMVVVEPVAAAATVETIVATPADVTLGVYDAASAAAERATSVDDAIAAADRALKAAEDALDTTKR